MSSATVGLVRPPMGPGMGGGGGMQPGMMEPPVVADGGPMGTARRKKRKKLIADGQPVKPIGGGGGRPKPMPPGTKPKPTITPKPVAKDPMKEIMGGVSPEKKMEV